jgi:hypothetical protein
MILEVSWMAFKHFLLGSHNYMGTALGSCAKVALRGVVYPKFVERRPYWKSPLASLESQRMFIGS